jgi:hypothetical protein
MTPHKKIIVAVDLQQRSNYMIKYGSLELWMDSSFGEDGKHTNPQLAEVVSVGEGVEGLLPGMQVLCHYNTFTGEIKNGYLFGSHEEKDAQGRSLFTINPSRVRCYLDAEGMPVPVKGFLLVNRIKEQTKSSLIIPEVAEKEETVWFIVMKANEGLPYKTGDLVLGYKYADVVFKYTINKTPVECIVVKEDDVHGVMNN